MIVIRLTSEEIENPENEYFCNINCFDYGHYGQYYAFSHNVLDPSITLDLMNKSDEFLIYENESILPPSNESSPTMEDFIFQHSMQSKDIDAICALCDEDIKVFTDDSISYTEPMIIYGVQKND
tara:strand:- start:2462 stop:2833 length:372 start_codon:yes stop_codon:yes gene_type:complete